MLRFQSIDDILNNLMPEKKVLTLGLCALLLVLTGSWWVLQRQNQSPVASSEGAPARSEHSPSQGNGLDRLAQHHCARLQVAEQVAACREHLQQADLTPQTTSFDAQACDAVSDPAEQHLCHARLGLDFALSTGDIERCKVIPLDELKAICRIAITVNEVKKLYALESELAKRSE